MKSKHQTIERPRRYYFGDDVPMRVIRRFARQVAERFQPDKIILFGSFAYGTPNADSDVDILVVMPAQNQIDQAVKISLAIDPPFAMDIIVRTPHAMRWRLAEGDSFLQDITSREKFSMRRLTKGWVRKAEADFKTIKEIQHRKDVYDVVCFHCQQCTEKYLKALLAELSRNIPRTHNLVLLLTLLLPDFPSLGRFRRGLDALTRRAVDTRYPGDNASKRQAVAAIRWAGEMRKTCRTLLNIATGRSRRMP